jgi:hypothetical protein
MPVAVVTTKRRRLIVGREAAEQGVHGRLVKLERVIQTPHLDIQAFVPSH